MSQLAATARRWLPAACFTLANLYLAAVLSLAAWAFLPVAFGWTPLVITSDSMTPTISTGDMVVIAPYDGRPLDVGTVVTYHETGRLVTHRIAEVIDAGYITQGDANREPDSTTLTADAIEGTGRVLVPYLARPYTWFTSGHPGPALLWGTLTAGALLAVSLRAGVREATPDHRESDNDRRRGGRGASPAWVNSDQPDAGVTVPTPVAVPQQTEAVAQPEPDDETTVPTLEATPRPTGVWHATKPLGPTRARSAGRMKGNLGAFLRAFGITMCAGLVLAVGTAAAPLSSATDSPASWQAQLAPPTDVDAQAGCSDGTPHVDVTWTANPKADGYDIHRKVNDGTWQLVHTTADGATEAWRDDSVEDGNDYHYRMTAFLASGWESDLSNEDPATVDATLACT